MEPVIWQATLINWFKKMFGFLQLLLAAIKTSSKIPGFSGSRPTYGVIVSKEKL